jgi:hypothetical protein
VRTVPARVRRHVGSRTKGLYRYYVCSTRYGYWTEHCPGERLRVSGAAERTTWWLSLPEERFREGPTLPAGRPDQRALRQPKTRAFAELLIDCAEDRTLRAVIVGMLREG